MGRNHRKSAKGFIGSRCKRPSSTRAKAINVVQMKRWLGVWVFAAVVMAGSASLVAADFGTIGIRFDQL
jgi:hypothetical protein